MPARYLILKISFHSLGHLRVLQELCIHTSLFSPSHHNRFRVETIETSKTTITRNAQQRKRMNHLLS